MTLVTAQLCSVATAQPPVVPPPTTTLWNFLGIPQAFNKMRDARVNRNGNRPNAERKPPLKRIGDPANLFSKNPAIKTAAEVKTEEDLAKQKIKAIKYLGTIGCGCYPGVKEALLAALDDCTEAVRLAAANALAEAAGCVCRACNKTCCDLEVRAKLADVAFGMTEDGCPKEASAEVRAAAARALNACGGPPPQAEPIQVPEREVPLPLDGREIPTPPLPPPVPPQPSVRFMRPAPKSLSQSTNVGPQIFAHAEPEMTVMSSRQTTTVRAKVTSQQPVFVTDSNNLVVQSQPASVPFGSPAPAKAEPTAPASQPKAAPQVAVSQPKAAPQVANPQADIASQPMPAAPKTMLAPKAEPIAPAPQVTAKPQPVAAQPKAEPAPMPKPQSNVQASRPASMKPVTIEPSFPPAKKPQPKVAASAHPLTPTTPRLVTDAAPAQAKTEVLTLSKPQTSIATKTAPPAAPAPFVAQQSKPLAAKQTPAPAKAPLTPTKQPTLAATTPAQPKPVKADTISKREVEPATPAQVIASTASIFDGEVVTVNKDAGMVRLDLAGGNAAKVGQRVRVYQTKDARRIRLGELEIVHNDAGAVWARPTDGVSVSNISTSDVVMLLSATSAPTQTVRKPVIASDTFRR
jgi:hypothetical protein